MPYREYWAIPRFRETAAWTIAESASWRWRTTRTSLWPDLEYHQTSKEPGFLSNLREEKQKANLLQHETTDATQKSHCN